jgi:hypothetical protein
MYWANRIVDPKFNNQYYQANLVQFWKHTYEGLGVALVVAGLLSLILFPWGLGMSATHPLSNYGWGMALGVGVAEVIITLFFLAVVSLYHKPIVEHCDNLVCAFLGCLIMGGLVQHAGSHWLYQTVPYPFLASITPMLLFWSLVTGLVILPTPAIESLDEGLDKVVDGLAFLIFDPFSGKARLTILVGKILGEAPEDKVSADQPDLASPLPKDFKIWGVKSSEEKELQKILDE